MLPEAIAKLLKRDISKLYGIKVEGVRLFNEYEGLRFGSKEICAKMDLEMCFVEVLYDGVSNLCVYKQADGYQDAIGFLENPSISPALISYSIEPRFYTLSAYAGRCIDDLGSDKIEERMLADISDNLFSLKRTHGDLDSVNLILNEVPPLGHAVTKPDPKKKVLFVDYSDYGLDDDRTLDVAQLLFGLNDLPDKSFNFLVKQISQRLGRKIDEKNVGKALLRQLGEGWEIDIFIERLSKLQNAPTGI